MTGTPDAVDVMREMHRSCERWVCPHCQGELVFHNIEVWKAGYEAAGVRAAQAQAWDECWETVVGGSEVYVGAYIPNPYRSEPVDEFQDSED